MNGGQPPWHEKFDNVYSAMFYIGNSTDLPSNIPDCLSDNCRDFLGRCFERNVANRASVKELLNHPWIVAASETPTTTSDGLGDRKWSEMFDSESEAPSSHPTLSRQGTSLGIGSPVVVQPQGAGFDADTLSTTAATMHVGQRTE